ncbi:epidermal retinol dehydrogenase 2-like [Mercenaria mercenaria]|uniref:epidermal retinol dehydrogenase 2-like n=1 Tax=Mercenaria mercenaria TaxID=6596 RepID=UPI00234F8E4D|nr:epidermal retinol dehydrogenase 2-like [Mercenaria mercenaria]XP_053382740.1 epidermal retinol dehydrogenase 2-like [Mercenaria mercenaria]
MAESFVEILTGTLKCLCLVLYHWIVAVLKAVLPASVQAKDISGETVLITGAGSGIGRLMAVRFAKLKCRLVLWDVNEKGNVETLSMCQEYGVTAKAYTINLCDREDVYDIANKVKQEIGQIDILVNNAGIVTGKKFLDCPDNMIQKTMEVNAMAHFWTVKAFLPDMLKRNHGHIVNVASSAGFIGVTGLADYCASKFAAVGFEESLRFELESLGKDGVHTTVVCPFFINTGMFEGAKTRFPFLLPVLEPDYVARKIVEAVLCNQVVLCIPRILYIFYAVKGMIPHQPGFVISKYLGAHNLMDSFVGRQKNE